MKRGSTLTDHSPERPTPRAIWSQDAYTHKYTLRRRGYSEQRSRVLCIIFILEEKRVTLLWFTKSLTKKRSESLKKSYLVDYRARLRYIYRHGLCFELLVSILSMYSIELTVPVVTKYIFFSDYVFQTWPGSQKEGGKITKSTCLFERRAWICWYCSLSFI